MPCSDGYDDIRYPHRVSDDFVDEKKFLEAALCLLMRTQSDITEISQELWLESGITYGKLVDWYEEHLRKDELRKIKEKLEEDFKRFRKEAADKLTPEERKALGIEWWEK